MTEHESIHLPPIDPETLTAFIALFFPRPDLYATQRVSGYTCVHKPVTPELVLNHFAGTLTLGTYCLNTDSQAQWVVIDVDDENTWQTLHTVAAECAYPVFLEQSRRGGHAWVFFSEPILGGDARRFTKSLLSSYTLKRVEIYPRQDKLSDGPGSLIRVPFGYHRKVRVPGKPGKRYCFETHEGQPLAGTIREQMRLLVHADHIPHAVIQTILAELPSSEPTLRGSSLPFELRPVREELPLSERIKARIGVFDFIANYVPLDAQGSGFCPFHEDEHRSFGVNHAGNYWHCFAGCGGGSVIDFWMKWREREGKDNSFIATITELAVILQLEHRKEGRS